MSSLLSVKHMEKRFDRTQALSGISLDIGRKERRAIIGPNGAGKSTLFNLITGQLRPTAGSIFFEDFEITDQSVEVRARRGIARALQTPSLFPSLTVFENLLAATQRGEGWLRTSHGAVEQAERVSKQIGLQNQMSTPSKNLAHGDQRLLEIGMALATRPRLLLLDEPMAGLSGEERVQITQLIKNLDEISLVFIEHDLEAIFELADRITLLHHGCILAEGSPDEIQNDERAQQVYLGAKDSND